MVLQEALRRMDEAAALAGTSCVSNRSSRVVNGSDSDVTITCVR